MFPRQFVRLMRLSSLFFTRKIDFKREYFRTDLNIGDNLTLFLMQMIICRSHKTTAVQFLQNDPSLISHFGNLSKVIVIMKLNIKQDGPILFHSE
jgi:hypothetical protein